MYLMDLPQSCNFKYAGLSTKTEVVLLPVCSWPLFKGLKLGRGMQYVALSMCSSVFWLLCSSCIAAVIKPGHILLRFLGIRAMCRTKWLSFAFDSWHCTFSNSESYFLVRGFHVSAFQVCLNSLCEVQAFNNRFLNLSSGVQTRLKAIANIFVKFFGATRPRTQWQILPGTGYFVRWAVTFKDRDIPFSKICTYLKDI